MHLCVRGLFLKNLPIFDRYFLVTLQQERKKKPLDKEMKTLDKIVAIGKLIADSAQLNCILCRQIITTKYHSTEKGTLGKDCRSAVHLQAGLSATPCWWALSVHTVKWWCSELQENVTCSSALCICSSASQPLLADYWLFGFFWIMLWDPSDHPPRFLLDTPLVSPVLLTSCRLTLLSPVASPAPISRSCSFQMDWNGFFKLFHFPKINWEPYICIWNWDEIHVWAVMKIYFQKIWPPGFSWIQVNWSWLLECQWIMCQESLCTESVINRLYT